MNWAAREAAADGSEPESRPSCIADSALIQQWHIINYAQLTQKVPEDDGCSCKLQGKTHTSSWSDAKRFDRFAKNSR